MRIVWLSLTFLGFYQPLHNAWMILIVLSLDLGGFQPYSHTHCSVPRCRGPEMQTCLHLDIQIQRELVHLGNF